MFDYITYDMAGYLNVDGEYGINIGINHYSICFSIEYQLTSIRHVYCRNKTMELKVMLLSVFERHCDPAILADYLEEKIENNEWRTASDDDSFLCNLNTVNALFACLRGDFDRAKLLLETRS